MLKTNSKQAKENIKNSNVINATIRLERIKQKIII